MALSARNRDDAAPVHGSPCSISRVYDAVQHDPGELAELNVVLYEEGNSESQAYAILTQHGEFPFQIGTRTINKHRGGKCRCFKYAPFKFCALCRRDLPSCVCDAA